MAALVMRTHTGTETVLDLCIGPLVGHEMKSVPRMHEQLQAGTVLVADRGFCSYTHLELVIQRGQHVVFRLHRCEEFWLRWPSFHRTADAIGGLSPGSAL